MHNQYEKSQQGPSPNIEFTVQIKLQLIMKTLLCVQNGVIPKHPTKKSLKQTLIPCSSTKESHIKSFMRSFIIKDQNPSKAKTPSEEHEQNMVFMNLCLRKRALQQKKTIQRDIFHQLQVSVESRSQQKFTSIPKKESFTKNNKVSTRGSFNRTLQTFSSSHYRSKSEKKTTITKQTYINLCNFKNEQQSIFIPFDKQFKTLNKKEQFRKINGENFRKNGEKVEINDLNKIDLLIEGVKSPTRKKFGNIGVAEMETLKKKFRELKDGRNKRSHASGKKCIKVIKTLEREEQDEKYFSENMKKNEGREFIYRFEDFITEGHENKEANDQKLLRNHSHNPQSKNLDDEHEYYLKTIKAP